MPDPDQIDEIRMMFARLTAAFEDAAGTAARGQGVANLDAARKDHAHLAKFFADVAGLMDCLEAQLR